MNRNELLDILAEQILAIDRPHPVRVAIDGGSAAGKTILADELAATLKAAGRTVIRGTIDGFHNLREIRYARGRGSVDGYYLDSFNYPAARRQLLDPLGPTGNRRYRLAVHDIETDGPVESPLLCAPGDAVLLFDGVMILREQLNDCWDYRIHVHADEAEVLRRARVRDAGRLGSADAVESKYLGRYLPAQRRYVAETAPHEIADAVVINDEPADPDLLLPEVLA